MEVEREENGKKTKKRREGKDPKEERGMRMPVEVDCNIVEKKSTVMSLANGCWLWREKRMSEKEGIKKIIF